MGVKIAFTVIIALVGAGVLALIGSCVRRGSAPRTVRQSQIAVGSLYGLVALALWFVPL